MKWILRIRAVNNGMEVIDRAERFTDLVELVNWWEGHRGIHGQYWANEGYDVKTTVYKATNIELENAY